MKCSLVVLVTLLINASAFTGPLLATRAIGKTKPVAKKAASKPVAKKAAPAFSFPSFGKAPAAKPAAATKAVKKVAPKKAVAKKAAPKLKAPSLPKVSRPKGTGRAPPPASKSYPSFSAQASSVKFRGISGSGLFPPPSGGIPQPDFSDPKLQIKRDPAFYAAAAKERAAKLASGQALVIDDGLTDLERKQRKTQAEFLTGSAKSQRDETAVIGDIDAPAFGGLSADRFQLLFISVFGLFTLVGSLANAKPYV